MQIRKIELDDAAQINIEYEEFLMLELKELISKDLMPDVSEYIQDKSSNGDLKKGLQEKVNETDLATIDNLKETMAEKKKLYSSFAKNARETHLAPVKELRAFWLAGFLITTGFFLQIIGALPCPVDPPVSYTHLTLPTIYSV